MLRKIFSLLTILALAIVLAACKDNSNDDETTTTNQETTTTTAEETTTTEEQTTTTADTVAPLILIVETEVTLEYNTDYDLMTGVTARDNVDGTITDLVQVDDGEFSKTTPGTYTITYTVTDSAGLSAEETRTIIVNEARATIEIEGQQFPIIYNYEFPYRDSVSERYPNDKAIVIEKAYHDWMVANQPNRYIALWSIIAIIDANGDVVETRDFNTNETTADGSRVGTDWCTGSATGTNNEWCSHLGMLANIEVPTDGHVVIFANTTNNDVGGPREFGGRFYATAGEDPATRLSRSISINGVMESEKFDATDTLPTLTLDPIDFEVGVGGTLPDLTQGVSATDEQDGDLTVDINKIYYYNDDNEAVEVEESAMSTDAEIVYYVEYQTTDTDGNTDIGTRLVQVKTQEVKGTVTINDNSFEAIYNFTTFATEYNAKSYAYVLSRDYVEQLLTDNPSLVIKFSEIAIVDEYGQVVNLRHLMGTELNADHPTGTTPSDWTNTNQFAGILDDIPTGGYIVVFPNYSDNSEGTPRHFGLTNLFSSTGDKNTPDINPLNIRINWLFAGHSESVQSEYSGTISIDGDQFNAVYNYSQFNNSDLRSQVSDVQVLSKEYLAARLEAYRLATIDESNPNGKLLVIQYSFVTVVDANGNVVEVRNVVGGMVNAENPDSTATHDWVNSNQLMGITDVVPDGGYLVIFLNQGGNLPDGQRAFGANHLWSAEGFRATYDKNTLDALSKQIVIEFDVLQ